jgi:DMSO/TMAO reductase YedYZ heme-binding membrane subunit
VLLAIGAGLFVLGIAAPRRLAVLNRAWIKLGALLAMVINPIVLMLLFLLVVTPMAFFMRLLGKRPLRLAPDPTAASYWIKREPQSGSSTMRQQF